MVLIFTFFNHTDKIRHSPRAIGPQILISVMPRGKVSDQYTVTVLGVNYICKHYIGITHRKPDLFIVRYHPDNDPVSYLYGYNAII